ISRLKRSSRSADFRVSASNAAPMSGTVRFGGGASCAMISWSSPSMVSFASQQGQRTTNDFDDMGATLTAGSRIVNITTLAGIVIAALDTRGCPMKRLAVLATLLFLVLSAPAIAGAQSSSGGGGLGGVLDTLGGILGIAGGRAHGHVVLT